MSVNIFEATNKNTTNVHGVRGQPGIGFKFLDDEGNFDIDNKRLANLSDPIEDNDATPQVYVNRRVVRLENALMRVININKSKYEDSINKVNEKVIENKSKYEDEINKVYENIINLEISSGKVIENESNVQVLTKNVDENKTNLGVLSGKVYPNEINMNKKMEYHITNQ